MANMLPILLLGGAAVMLMGGGKKKPKRRVGPSLEYERRPEFKTAGPPAATASKKTWIERQKSLKYLADKRVCAACHPGVIDGVYGRNTKMAILAFQALAGIEPTGKWTPETEAKMKQALDDAAKIGVEPTAEEPAIPGEEPLVSSELWAARQKKLARLAERGVCAACHPGPITGVYDNNTKMAILAFQAFAGIAPDGKWGPQTENALAQAMADLEKMPLPTYTISCELTGIRDDHSINSEPLEDGTPMQGHAHKDMDEASTRKLSDAVAMKKSKVEGLQLKQGSNGGRYHTHSFNLAKHQLEALLMGQSTTAMTSIPSHGKDNHRHQLTIVCTKR